MSRGSRTHKEEEGIEGTELNLVPYLDIMVNLIMFMLVTYTVMAELGMISFNPPAAGPVNKTPGQKSDEKPLLLTVGITERGFSLLTPDSGMEVVPKTGDGKYDYKELTRRLARIKGQVKVDPHLIIAAEGTIKYDIVVQTMDAARENPEKLVKDKFGKDVPSALFPEVSLGMALGAGG
jgi:biopolymer transport protein TolR